VTTAPPPSTRCPGCGGRSLTDVFSQDGVPVFVGLLYGSAEAAKRAPTGDITLTFCHGCGLVFNRRFDPAKLAFAPGYDASLVHSPAYRAFLDDLADGLVERHALRGRTVLEIGCGAGHLLRRLCERGVARAIGVDPTVARTGTERVGKGTIEWRREWFDPARAGELGHWDFACSVSVFEDLPRPLETVTWLARLCAERGATAYVDVFHAARAFEAGETWSVHFEESNYFGLDTFVGLFRRGGFRVRDAGPCFQGGESLFVDLEPGPDPAAAEPEAPLAIPPGLATLAARHRAGVEVWTERLEELGASGRRVVLWGSGGKGVSFLAAVPNRDRIACVVDVHPGRQGRWIPVSGLQVVAPETLVSLDPHVVVVTNPLYREEIRAQLASMEVACEVMAA